MSHTAEIIAVGTELLLGNIANTNAQEISESLSTLGINVFWHTVVGDNPIRLKEALDIARRRADILITTGGLGPTYDDLTKQTICEVFGKPLVLHRDILEEIREFYEGTVHAPMPENNTQQAELPAGCVIFENPVGTAPGCAFEQDGVLVLEKKLEDCTVSGQQVSVRLTEEDTLAFRQNGSVLQIQLRCGIGEKRLASEVITATVGRILKEGTL